MTNFQVMKTKTFYNLAEIKSPTSNFMRFLFISVFCFLIGTVNAQEKPLSTIMTIGWAIPILDGGSGIHVGINPDYNFSNFFAIEGQLSYAFANVNKFLIGDPARVQATSALIGGRIYILEEDRKFRPYLNLMGGVLYYFEKDKTTNIDSSFFTLGLSAGLYMKIKKRFTVGVAGEALAFVVVKAGYNL